MYNTANVGGVDGPPQNSDGFRLRAVIDPDADDDAPSKLRVGPRFLPRFLYGPYWVVAVSPRCARLRKVFWFLFFLLFGARRE